MNRRLSLLAALALILTVACGEKAPPPETFSEGRRLIEAGDYAAAQQYFEAESAAAPLDPEPVFLAGQAAALGARFAEAEAHLNKALELKPETAQYYSWLGRVYGAQARSADLLSLIGLAPKVQKNFEKAYELDPKDAETKFFLGLFYVAAPPRMGGDPAKAQAFATEMMSDHPVMAHRLLAQVHAAAKAPDLAEAEYKTILELAPEDSQSYTDLASFYLAQQNLPLALENFNRALELNPADQGALFGLGQLATASPDYTDQGIEALNNLLALPATILSPNRGQAAFFLSTIHEREGNPEDSLAALEVSAGMGFAPAQKKLDALKAPAETAPAAETETTGTLESAAPEAATDDAAATETEPVAAGEAVDVPAEEAADATGD